MRHIKVTNKRGQMILIHVDDLKEAYPANDEKHSICVVRVADSRDKKDDTFLVVLESTQEIYEQMKKLECKEVSNG